MKNLFEMKKKANVSLILVLVVFGVLTLSATTLLVTGIDLNSETQSLNYLTSSKSLAKTCLEEVRKRLSNGTTNGSFSLVSGDLSCNTTFANYVSDSTKTNADITVTYANGQYKVVYLLDKTTSDYPLVNVNP